MSAEPAKHLDSDAIAADPLAGLTDEQRAAVGVRIRIVEGWRQICADYAAMGMHRRRATASYLRANPDLSERTLQRWSAALDADGPAGLVDRRAVNCPPSAQGLCSPEAWSFFLELYLDIRRPTVAACWQMTRLMASKNAWTWPSLRSVQRRVAGLSAFETDYHRLGQREWARRHEPKIHRDFSAYRSGQTWCADFREADVFCRKSDADPAICRPLLSGFRDMRSRVVVGRHIGLRECQDTVLLALRCGIERYGPPAELLIDNGKPYRARGVSGGRGSAVRLIDDEDYVRSVLGGLMILPHFATPYGPNSKPIEGWFAVMGDQFDRTFATYCGGAKDDLFKSASRLAHDRPELAPTVAEYAAKFDRWLDAYHATPNHGDDLAGMTPAEAWATFDPIARRVLPDGALDILLMRVTDPVCVRAGEVVCDGLRYYDTRLLALNGRQVRLRRDSEDAGFVLVCDLEGKPLFRAVNYRLGVMGVKRDDVAAAMAEKARARRLCRQVREGAARPAQRDLSDLAIEARLAAGDQTFMDKLAAATGTDGRTVAPLRSDFAQAVETFNRTEAIASVGGVCNPDRPKRRSLADMLEAADEGRVEAPSKPRRTLAEMIDEDAASGAGAGADVGAACSRDSSAAMEDEA